MSHMIQCRPQALPEEVLTAVSNWVQSQHTRLFALVLTENLDRILVYRIYAERSHFENIEALDVIVDSSGGDIEAAYQLVTFARQRCKKLRVFIPDWAKSAATLFALGADEIWMSETAELGPLDAQIPDPRESGEFISALDEFRAIDYLRDHGYAIFDEFVRLLIRRTHLRLKDVIGHAIEYSARIMTPLYSQVDPLYFGGAHRALEMSIEYGKRVMSRHAYSAWSDKKIGDVLKRLTWEYHSHSFVIDYHEAEKLGLRVHLLTGEMADNAHAIIKGVTDCVGFIDKEIPAPAAARAAGG